MYIDVNNVDNNLYSVLLFELIRGLFSVSAGAYLIIKINNNIETVINDILCKVKYFINNGTSVNNDIDPTQQCQLLLA